MKKTITILTSLIMVILMGLNANAQTYTDLIISEYVEGSSFNKAIEIYNKTGNSVNLSNYSLKKQTNGAGNYSNELVLFGTLANNSTFVIAYRNTGTTGTDLTAFGDLDTAAQAVNFNGNDAVALFKNGVKIDEVGVFNQVADWGKDTTFRRKCSIISPNLNFTMTEWDYFPKDTVSGLGNHCIAVIVTIPTVTSVAASGITQTSALCGGNVTSDGGAAITERGICYSTFANPTTADTKVTASGTTGAFTANLTNLTANTTYHFRAYAINSSGTSYGADLDFLTASGSVAPVVTTGAVSAITSSTATVAGEVTNDGGAAITERGICWSTSANPTIADMKVSVAGTTGTFSGNLTSLTGSTLYHVRAYATNSVGTSYGTDVTFTTAVAAIQVASIAELRAKPADNSTLYQLSNEVILTCKITNRNQKYIQDASAAILIDDPNPAKITTVYNVGDGITGIKGKLYNYFGLLEFVPVADPGPATSGQNDPAPFVITAANMLDTNFMKAHQSKLIKMENIAFAATGTFANGKKYKMTQGATTDSLFYTYIYGADYIGLNIPTGNGSVVGVVNMSYNKYYITARSKMDISLLTGVNEVENNLIGVYPNPTNGKFSLNSDKLNDGQVKIFSMVGDLVIFRKISKGNNEFDLSNYGKGIYFVNFTDSKSGKSWTEKLVVK